MATGYEANFYRQFDVLTQSMRSIESSLNTIANCMQAAELRARRQEGTTPEDIERIGEAVAAVRRGFADMEQSIRKESGT